MVPAKDISKWQGNWKDTGEPIVMIKMSGGDDGLYMDSEASANYNGAVAAGRAVGGYHYTGWTNPASEANYFMQAMSPKAENDVYALDAEAIPAGIDPVAWCLTFMQTIKNAINVNPLIYMNLSTLNAHDWSPVLKNSGLWLADWNNDPNATLPTMHTYVMQQYSDGPVYDHDEWFGTVDEFKLYGWHAPVPATPIPTPPPVVITTNPPTPVIPPVEPPLPSPTTVITPTPVTPSTPPTTGQGTTTPVPVHVIPKKVSGWQSFMTWLLSVFKHKKG
jgi:hypothetical protein